MIFKTRNNVPDIYTIASRDFQLFESVIDALVNNNLSNIAKINYLRYPAKLDSKLLKLLSSYVGFFTSNYYPDELLRSVLINFPTIIKNKGTLKAIELAVKALQNAYTSNADIQIIRDPDQEDNYTYLIQITGGHKVDSIYLNDLLKYVRPVGIILKDIINTSLGGTTRVTIIPQKNPGIILRNNIVSSEDASYTYGLIRKDPTAPVIDVSTDAAGRAASNIMLSGVGHTPVVKINAPMKIYIGENYE